MSTKNPELKNIDRSSYELPTLLQRLGVTSLSETLTSKQRQMSEAVRAHALNQQQTLASGMESIGQLIYLAGDSKDTVDPYHIRNLGLLISQLSIQLEFLLDIDGEMETNLTHVPEKKGGAQ